MPWQCSTLQTTKIDVPVTNPVPVTVSQYFLLVEQQLLHVAGRGFCLPHP